jgi:hypothetical protein
MPNVSGKISSEGRGPLGWGEKQVLAEQHRNRNLADGNTPEDDERARMQRIATSTDLKRARREVY